MASIDIRVRPAADAVPPAAGPPPESPRAQETASKVNLFALWLLVTALSFVFFPPDKALTISGVTGLLCLLIAFPPPPGRPYVPGRSWYHHDYSPIYVSRISTPPPLVVGGVYPNLPRPAQQHVPVGGGHTSIPTPSSFSSWATSYRPPSPQLNVPPLQPYAPVYPSISRVPTPPPPLVQSPKVYPPNPPPPPTQPHVPVGGGHTVPFGHHVPVGRR